jgi:hypothetical protein
VIKIFICWVITDRALCLLTENAASLWRPQFSSILQLLKLSAFSTSVFDSLDDVSPNHLTDIISQVVWRVQCRKCRIAAVVIQYAADARLSLTSLSLSSHLPLSFPITITFIFIFTHPCVLSLAVQCTETRLYPSRYASSHPVPRP